MSTSPLIIAHRGFWKAPQASQNGLSAVQAAIDHQLDGIEIDLRMSKDGELFLIHNPYVKGHFIHRSSAETLRRLKISPTEYLSMYSDFIKTVKSSALSSIFIELKSTHGKARQQQLVTQVLQPLQAHDLLNRVVLISFNQTLLQHVQRQNLNVAIMPLYERPWRFSHIALKSPSTPWIGLDYHYALAQPDHILRLKKLGYRINLWTVNDLEIAKTLSALNPDALTTDFPLKIKAALSDSLGR